MAKFKAGDRIRAVTNDSFNGKTGMILEPAVERYYYRVVFKLKGRPLLFHEDELEFVYEVEGFEV